MKLLRKIVAIDTGRCDGCGACIRHCPQGALRLAGGTSQLIAERFCDGLGSCMDLCPTGAITLEERQAEEFDLPAEEAAASLSQDPGAHLFHHRLRLCCRATLCGRICERLIKQPGRAGVRCVDIRSNEMTDLYGALADPDFHCPDGRF